MSKEKSILDNVPVDESNWKPYRKLPLGGSSTAGQMVIVGRCVSCGNPVYGNEVIYVNQLRGESPVVYRTCSCPPQCKSFEESIETK